MKDRNRVSKFILNKVELRKLVAGIKEFRKSFKFDF